MFTRLCTYYVYARGPTPNPFIRSSRVALLGLNNYDIFLLCAYGVYSVIYTYTSVRLRRAYAYKSRRPDDECNAITAVAAPCPREYLTYLGFSLNGFYFYFYFIFFFLLLPGCTCSVLIMRCSARWVIRRRGNWGGVRSVYESNFPCPAPTTR